MGEPGKMRICTQCKPRCCDVCLIPYLIELPDHGHKSTESNDLSREDTGHVVGLFYRNSKGRLTRR